MKRKILSLILTVTLCITFVVPAFSAQEQTSDMTIAVPGLEGYANRFEEYNPETREFTETITYINDITITLTNAPTHYYTKVVNETINYVFLMPFGSSVTVSGKINSEQRFSGGGSIMRHIAEAGETFTFNEQEIYNNSKEWEGYVFHSYSFSFVKDDNKFAALNFVYFPDDELDIELADVWIRSYNGASLPAETDFAAPEEFGYEVHPISNLVAGANSPVIDNPSSWAEESVISAIAAGLVPESLQTKYTQNMTRAEFCALAVALYETVTGTEITERVKFDDSNDINVEKAAAIEVVNGVGNNRFDPNALLNREQAATMLARLASAVSKPLLKQSATFSDNNELSEWAAEAVGQVQAAGIMQGVGSNNFAPKDPYTREQSIITIMRLYDFVN